jgi:hypothetical protein
MSAPDQWRSITLTLAAHAKSEPECPGSFPPP